MRIYKRCWRDEDGMKHEAECFSVDFKMPNGGPMTMTLLADEDNSKAFARKLNRLIACKSCRGPLDRELKEREAREKTRFLMREDDAGCVADFHALRHTLATRLMEAGVHPKVIQSIMRHSTITLTMDR